METFFASLFLLFTVFGPWREFEDHGQFLTVYVGEGIIIFLTSLLIAWGKPLCTILLLLYLFMGASDDPHSFSDHIYAKYKTCIEALSKHYKNCSLDDATDHTDCTHFNNYIDCMIYYDLHDSCCNMYMYNIDSKYCVMKLTTYKIHSSNDFRFSAIFFGYATLYFCGLMPIQKSHKILTMSFVIIVSDLIYSFF